MDQTAIQSVAAGTVTQGIPMGIPVGVSESLSLWGMFWDAEPIIKLVILVLLGASLWCWTIIFQKIIRFRRLYAAAEQFEESFWSGGALDDLYDRINNRPQDPLSAIFCAAMREWRRSISKGLATSNDSRGTLQQRIEWVMQHVKSGNGCSSVTGFWLQAPQLPSLDYLELFWAYGRFQSVPLSRVQSSRRCSRYCRSSVCDGYWFDCSNTCRYRL